MSHLEAGSGEPVVLLHAFPMAAEMWRPQLEGLAPHWRVIAPPVTYPEPSVDAAADEVAALLDRLGLDRVVLGGLSMGGYVTLAFLRRHRSRVKAVVLADTRAEPDSDEVRRRRTSQQEQVAREGTGPVVAAMLEALPGQHTRAHRPEVLEEIARIMGTVTPGWVTVALEAMKHRPDSTPDLATIDVPVLVAVGEEDTVSPPPVAAAMAQAVPDGTLAVIPRAGHLANLEDPAAFNAALGDFLARTR